MGYEEKRRRAFSIFEVLFLLIGAGWIAWSSFTIRSKNDQSLMFPHKGFLAPVFSLEDRNGKVYQLGDYSGKVVIINFWASWCPPCRQEMPVLNSFYQEYSEQGVMLLSVNLTSQDNLNEVFQLVEDMNLSFPILLDNKDEVGRLYQINALPTTVFVAADGRIDSIIVGGPLAESFLKSTVDRLLKN